MDPVDSGIQESEMLNKQSGSHIGAVRNWMQRKFKNGSSVIWGSNDLLENSCLTVNDFEYLSQRIRDVVLREFKISLKEEENKRYKLFFQSGTSAFQWADTYEEIWTKLRKSTGLVDVYDMEEEINIHSGTTEETIRWLRDV